MTRPLPTQKTRTQPVTIRSWHPAVLHDLKASLNVPTREESEKFDKDYFNRFCTEQPEVSS